MLELTALGCFWSEGPHSKYCSEAILQVLTREEVPRCLHPVDLFNRESAPRVPVSPRSSLRLGPKINSGSAVFRVRREGG